MILPTSIKPDFEKAYVKANEMLIKSSVIRSFPFSPKELVKEQSSIACRSYETARKYGVNIADFGSDSARNFNRTDADYLDRKTFEKYKKYLKGMKWYD
jgi:hypothetical protein